MGNQVRQRLVLNLVAVAVYLMITLPTGYLAAVDGAMFGPSDTKGYLAIAEWFSGDLAEAPAATLIRPFLFPLLLAGIRALSHDAIAILLVQFIFWLLAVNLTARSIQVLTTGKIWMVAMMFMAINVSIIALTLRALTETTTILLLSLWTYLFVTERTPEPNVRRLILLVFLLSALAVVKPLFQIPLICFMAYAIFRARRQWRNVPLLLLALLPVILQLVLNRGVHNTYTLSAIAVETFDGYFFSQVYAMAEGISLPAARELGASWTTSQEIRYLSGHIPFTLLVFIQNVMIQNLLQASGQVADHAFLQTYSLVTNRLYYALHLIFLPLIVYVIGRLGKQERHDLISKLTLPYLFFLIILVASGISYLQGDRLVVIGLPLWLVVYSTVLHQILLMRAERRGATHP